MSQASLSAAVLAILLLLVACAPAAHAGGVQRALTYAGDAAADPEGYAARVRGDPGGEAAWAQDTACMILADTPTGNPAPGLCPQEPAAIEDPPAPAPEPDPADPGPTPIGDVEPILDAGAQLVEGIVREPRSALHHVAGFVAAIREFLGGSIALPLADALGRARSMGADGAREIVEAVKGASVAAREAARNAAARATDSLVAGGALVNDAASASIARVAEGVASAVARIAALLDPAPAGMSTPEALRGIDSETAKPAIDLGIVHDVSRVAQR